MYSYVFAWKDWPKSQHQNKLNSPTSLFLFFGFVLNHSFSNQAPQLYSHTGIKSCKLLTTNPLLFHFKLITRNFRTCKKYLTSIKRSKSEPTNDKHILINRLKKYLCSEKCHLDNVLKRHCLLKLIVGCDRYREINQTVREIKSIRATNNTWLTLNLHNTDGLTVKDIMPKEMNYIYFQSKLVHAFNKISQKKSTFQSQQVREYAWIDLLNEAKQNLTAFRMTEEKARNKGLKTKKCCMFQWCLFTK